jgi:hypothetical protein
MRRGGTIDMTGIGRAIASMPKFKRAARFAIQQRVEIEKEGLLKEYANHKVTQEIDMGATAENISNTLGGVGANANLFTFIGFDGGSSPTRPIRTILSTTIRTGNSVSSRVQGKGGAIPVASVSVYIPTEGQLKEVSFMPWEPGKSWIYGIENGISGFGYYMYKKFARGRSKLGLQSKYKVRNSSFRPIAYLGAMLDRFAIKLRRL